VGFFLTDVLAILLLSVGCIGGKDQKNAEKSGWGPQVLIDIISYSTEKL
jgi:hypothetical protein